MTKLTLRDLPLKDQKVLMRVDFNVPLNGKQMITDDTRIVASLPSIRYILDHGGSLILMSHLGRPKEKRVPEMSLKPCAVRLSQLLQQEVIFASDCIGTEVEAKVHELKPGQVLMLENLRFHHGEEHPDEDPAFVKSLAKLGSLYVNDAFGSAHRAHASTEAIAHLFPRKAAAGLLLEKEIAFLGATLQEPNHPFVAIIGGAKISTKCGVIEALMKKADVVLVGGGMSYTFFKAQGIPIGNSLCEDSFLDKAKQLLASSGIEGNAKLVLPRDIVITTQIKEGSSFRTVAISDGIPEGYEGVDVGAETLNIFSRELRDAKTVLWNGPLGVFEITSFAKGTNEIAHLIAGLKATTIVGGGDSIAALESACVTDKITHISTGGGATLEYLEFGTLPGVEALTDRKELTG